MTAEVVRLARGRRRVVAAVPLPERARARLEELVGDCELVDIRRAEGTERLVLAPPVSPQLIGKLKAAFPEARIVVVEVVDEDAGVRLGGPVTRATDAGADGYLVSRSLEQLAASLTDIASGDATEATQPALAAAQEQELGSLLEELLERRAQAWRHRDEPRHPGAGG